MAITTRSFLIICMESNFGTCVWHLVMQGALPTATALSELGTEIQT